MKFGFDAKTASIVGAAAFAALVASAPLATAEPAPPPVPVPAPLPAPGPEGAPVQAQSAGPAGPADPLVQGVPHLSSPENLPPGTTETPTQQTRLGYLRDLWHAMRTQEVSGGDALLLLTQRPLSSTPTAGMSPGPQPGAPAPAPAAPPTP